MLVLLESIKKPLGWYSFIERTFQTATLKLIFNRFNYLKRENSKIINNKQKYNIK